MKFTSWCGTRELELDACPFCGGEPEISHIGNDHTRSRKVEIKCGGCRVKRVDAALRNTFKWIEDVAVRNWNQRPVNTAKEE